MHEDNSFITLTYSDSNLFSKKLVYSDFQDFMKRLRYHFSDRKIGCLVTGEYGDLEKRPHWHAIIFNWRPSDLIYRYSNERGDKVYSSEILGPFFPKEVDGCNKGLWRFGKCEVGNVTFESAGYVSRYAAKKLVHGRDKEHDFEPISKKSSKNAIGKSYLETYWRDIFNYGECSVLDSKGCRQTVPIPRYYEKWFAKHKPQEWLRYVTEVKLAKMSKAELRGSKQSKYYFDNCVDRKGGRGIVVSKNHVRRAISNERFKRLSKFTKGDL